MHTDSRIINNDTNSNDKECLMPYLDKNTYKNSSLLQDSKLTELVDEIMLMGGGDVIRLNFTDEKELDSTRAKIYSMLNALERKEEYRTAKHGELTLDVIKKKETITSTFTKEKITNE